MKHKHKKVVIRSTLMLRKPKGWWICKFPETSKRRTRREYGRMKQIRKSSNLHMRHDHA